MHPEKAPSCDKRRDGHKEKKKAGGEGSAFDFSHGSLDPEKPEKEKREDDRRRSLGPDSFLAEKTPDEMHREIKDDQLIDEVHRFSL
jgi:hypothetical protein